MQTRCHLSVLAQKQAEKYGEREAFTYRRYGILAIPTKLAVQSWQSGYGRDAIPSYRLPLIYKDKNEYILILKMYEKII